MKPKILLIGGGGHCKSCIDVIEEQNKFQIAGIIDRREKVGTKVLGYEIIGTDGDLEELVSKIPNALITIGQIKSAKLRVNFFNQLKNIGYKLPLIISPFSKVSKHSFIGEGTIIMHQALVNAGAKIGSNCIINSKALVEHDVRIENNCHISTNAVLNGGVKVGQSTFVGSGAVVVNDVSITNNTFIKANSLVKGDK